MNVNSDSTFKTVTIVLLVVIAVVAIIVAVLLVIVLIRQQAIMKRAGTFVLRLSITIMQS